ncbi:hypothetical protein Tdes44962_MAKER01927 [Teratosphaeria destructans]|uniref:Uncharacterized protein n=1 Tax=Teratosphaeria destructans TaxID=418781 RepID=A0A9W7SWV1_9PEZI|nr:hypothetical protein Tdes44962_MAKER01927 [Teratosphaeria destructans]
MPAYILSSDDKYRLFAPEYASRLAQDGSGIYGIEHLRSAGIDEQVKEPEQLEAEPFLYGKQGIPQLDGPPDPLTAPTIPGCPPSSTQAPPNLAREEPAAANEAFANDLELPETPGTCRSVDSTDSEGFWSRPTARLQYVAAYFVAGGSLNEKERAGLRLWQAASAEQVHWEQHLDRAEALRHERASLGQYPASHTVRHPQAEAKWPDERLTDAGEDVVRQLEAVTGMSKKDCRGKEISTVFGEVRSRLA